MVDHDHMDHPMHTRCPKPLLPNSSLPEQNWANCGTPKIKVKPTRVSVQMGHPVKITKLCHLQNERLPRLLVDDCFPLGIVRAQLPVANLDGGARAFGDGGVGPELEHEDDPVPVKAEVGICIFVLEKSRI